AALDHYRTLDDRRRAGDSLWSLSRLYRYVGRPAESLETAQEAITILEQLPAGAELAMAYCNLSHIYVNADDVEDARVWGHRALELAQKLGHLEAQGLCRDQPGGGRLPDHRVSGNRGRARADPAGGTGKRPRRACRSCAGGPDVVVTAFQVLRAGRSLLRGRARILQRPGSRPVAPLH